MQQAVKELSQRERLALELKALNANVTREDRKAYMTEKNLTRTMLTNYMHGRVGNADRAVEMLLFFRKRIADREKVFTD